MSKKNRQYLKHLILVILIFGVNQMALAQQPASTYPIVAKDAAWCWFSDPRAIYYNGKSEQLYFTYINSKGDVMINSKNSKTTEIKNFVLHQALQVDDHNVPSILFLPDGKLLVFYTEHNGRFFMRKSKNPEDISAWEEERIIPFGGNRITYSHPILLKNENNRIYMFWRGSDWRPSLSYSDNFGVTWSSSQALVESKGLKNRPYLKVCSDNKSRIDFAFTDGHPGVEPTNSIYHMYYEKGAFFQTDGTPIKKINELPINHTDVNKVYDAMKTGVKSWISDIALDKINNPVIVYTRYPQDNDHRYHYAKWDGKQWKDEELCKAGGPIGIIVPGEKQREPNYSGGIVLDHKDPSKVYLSKVTNSVFEIEYWKKINDSDWISTPITTGSKINNMRPYVVSSGKNSVLLWMTGIYKHYTDFETDLRMMIKN